MSGQYVYKRKHDEEETARLLPIIEKEGLLDNINLSQNTSTAALRIILADVRQKVNRCIHYQIKSEMGNGTVRFFYLHSLMADRKRYFSEIRNGLELEIRNGSEAEDNTRRHELELAKIKLEVERLRQEGDSRDKNEINDLMNQLKDLM